jgi:uncharacterized membrane protein
MKEDTATRHSGYPRSLALANSKADLLDQLFTIASILIIAVGVVIKFVGLDHQSLWQDELATAVFTERDIPAGELYRQFWDDDGHPPLYYALTHYWIKIFPVTDEVALRSFSAALAAASSLAALLAFRRLLSMQGRVLLAVMISCSFGLLYYAQEARSYALLFFVSLMMLAITLMMWQRSQTERAAWWQILAAMFFAVALSYTHLWGLLFAFACWTTITTVALYRRNDEVRILFAGAITGAIVSIWPLSVLMNIENMNYSIEWMTLYTNPVILIRNTAHLLFGNLYALFLMIVILLWILLKNKIDLRRIVPMITWIALLPGIVAILAGIVVSYLFEPVLSPRNLIVIFPSVLVAITATMEHALPRSTITRLAPVIGVVWLLPSLEGYYSVHKTQWRESANVVKEFPACVEEPITVLQGSEFHTKGWSDRLPHRVYLQTDLIPKVYLGSAFKPAMARRDWDWPATASQGGDDLKRIVHSVVRENARTQSGCPVLLWMVDFPARVVDELEWPSGVEVRRFFEAAVVVAG